MLNLKRSQLVNSTSSVYGGNLVQGRDSGKSLIHIKCKGKSSSEQNCSFKASYGLVVSILHYVILVYIYFNYTEDMITVL